MKHLTTVIFAVFSLTVQGQSLEEVEARIVSEAKKLYQSEMASWYGTDLFLENYSQKDRIGGYFSYVKNDSALCIFFSRDDQPKVIGEVSFDSSYNTENALIDLSERDFNPQERDLYTIRTATLNEINEDTTLFKRYNNTSMNLIPLISDGEKKVYVLTGPQQNGVVIFGNDYLLTFDEANKLVSKKRLHNNIIPIASDGGAEEGQIVESTMHSHLPETGDFITATDVCTLMLYGKFTKWKQHNVVSKNYLNIWNCSTGQLTVLPMSTIEKINKHQKKLEKKRKKGK